MVAPLIGRAVVRCVSASCIPEMQWPEPNDEVSEAPKSEQWQKKLQVKQHALPVDALIVAVEAWSMVTQISGVKGLLSPTSVSVTTISSNSP